MSSLCNSFKKRLSLDRSTKITTDKNVKKDAVKFWFKLVLWLIRLMIFVFLDIETPFYQYRFTWYNQTQWITPTASFNGTRQIWWAPVQSSKGIRQSSALIFCNLNRFFNNFIQTKIYNQKSNPIDQFLWMH